MSKREEIEQRTEALVTPILDSFGFDLWDVEYVKEGADYYLRAYIDKEGGITIDDCVDVSRKLSDKLDEDDFIEEAYILEVSSPGLGRKLKKDKEFARCIGRDIEIKLFKALDGTREFAGVLSGYDKDTVTIESAEGVKVFNRADAAVIKLAMTDE